MRGTSTKAVGRQVVGALIAGALLLSAPAFADVPGAERDCLALPVNTCLAEPFFPGQPADASLGASGAPDDDLGAALDRLAAAGDGTAAGAAADEALAILEGDPSVGADKAYRGMPLLNWNLPAKVRDVDPGTRTVHVREVRFGDHALLDTWLVRVPAGTEDQGYTIVWHVAELGGAFGGVLGPATLGTGGTGGDVLSPPRPLVLPNLLTGTVSHSRFHRNGSTPIDLPEETRLAEQTVTVAMPAPGTTNVVLDPNLKPGHESFAQLAPFSASRLAAAELAFGFSGASPTAAERATAIGRLSDLAPEKQIWTTLTGLDRAALADVSDPGHAEALAAAKSAGTGGRDLVTAMRSRDTPPSGVPGDPAADVNVTVMNDEAYVSRNAVRLASGAAIKVAIRNADGFGRSVQVAELRGRRATRGADDWGQFDWHAFPGAALAAGDGAQTLTVTPADDAFALWVGDPGLGDQAGAVIQLDRGPRRQSLRLGEDFSVPLHDTMDASGKLWVTIAGVDKLVRITPADDLAASTVDEFPLPGGQQAFNSAGPLFGPLDVAVDGRGIVWASLGEGNALARMDPSQSHPGTSDGVTIKDLLPCDDSCRVPPLPAALAPLSRIPGQMELFEDGGGNTVIVFTELNADRIGMMRFAPDGTKLNEVHLPCGCIEPLGIAIDPDGDIWFSEGITNRLGRLRLDDTRPYAESTVEIRHFKLPGGIETFTPGVPLCPAVPGGPCDPPEIPNPAVTNLPHSIAFDRAGRLWWAGEVSQALGYLDPDAAQPNTTSGMHVWDLPANAFKRRVNPADLGIDRAGSVFVADEYGDAILQARPGASAAAQPAWSWLPPTDRNSLTDAPLPDADGNLWFLEAGAAIITRISGVTAGLPNPGPAPSIVAETATGALSASGLREMSAIDVTVRRGGAVVTRADAVPVAGGAFELGGSGRPWDVAGAPALRGDDQVTFTPRGVNAPAPFSFHVADLAGAMLTNGAVTGHARTGGSPLFDRVRLAAGASTAMIAIDVAAGTYQVGPGPLPVAASPRTVSYTTASPSATFRTVTPIAAPGGASQDAPGGASQDEVPGAARITPRPAPVQPLVGTVRPGGAAACAATSWLRRTGRGSAMRRTLPLLGLTAARVERCLGAPDRRAASWTYNGRIALKFRRGRVAGFDLLGPGMRSAPDGAAVGGSLAALRRALGRVAGDPSAAGAYRAVLRQSSGYADVRISVRRGRVRSVRVRLVSRTALDRHGRSMAGVAS